MSKKRVRDAWESYRRDVIHPDAPPAQLLAMEIAFYGGVAAMSAINDSIGDTRVSEDEGLAILTEIQEELEEYVANLLRRF